MKKSATQGDLFSQAEKDFSILLDEISRNKKDFMQQSVNFEKSICLKQSKHFDRENRKKQILEQKLADAVPLKERSNSNNSRSPTFKQYKKYVSNESPAWLTTIEHSYELNNKVGYLKNEDLGNTELHLKVNLLPRSYKDEKNQVGAPFIKHAGNGKSFFQNEIADPLHPYEPKYSTSSGINKFAQPSQGVLHQIQKQQQLTDMLKTQQSGNSFNHRMELAKSQSQLQRHQISISPLSYFSDKQASRESSIIYTLQKVSIQQRSRRDILKRNESATHHLDIFIQAQIIISSTSSFFKQPLNSGRTHQEQAQRNQLPELNLNPTNSTLEKQPPQPFGLQTLTLPHHQQEKKQPKQLFMGTIFKPTLSSAAQMSLLKSQEDYKQKLRQSMEEEKARYQVRRQEATERYNNSPKWIYNSIHNPTAIQEGNEKGQGAWNSLQKGFFAPLKVDERVVIHEKESKKLELQFKLRDKPGFRVPKKDTELFRKEKGVVE